MEDIKAYHLVNRGRNLGISKEQVILGAPSDRETGRCRPNHVGFEDVCKTAQRQPLSMAWKDSREDVIPQ
jgi:hypothetical protein